MLLLSYVCGMCTAASYIVCCVSTYALCHGHCRFVQRELLLHIRIILCVLPNVLCFGHCYFVLVPRTLLLHMLHAVYIAACFIPWALLF